MKIAVFDFDGTLCYAPSSVFWTSDIPFFKRVSLLFDYLHEKTTKHPKYQKKAFEYIVGTDAKKIIKRIKKLPAVPKGIEKLNELKKEDYRIIVMSFSPASFVSAWLDEKGIEAEVICPDILIDDSGKIKGVSEDWVTKIFLEDIIHAKKTVLKKYNILPSISVGDNTKRDKVCEEYIDIRKYQKPYKNKIFQILSILFER